MDYFGNQIDITQFVCRTRQYLADINLLANQALNSQSITLDGEEMFFAIMRLMSWSTARFRIQLYDSTGRRYHSAGIAGANSQVRDDCVFGTAQRPRVLPVPILIPGSGAIMYDLTDISGAPNALHLVFEGVQLFPR